MDRSVAVENVTFPTASFRRTKRLLGKALVKLTVDGVRNAAANAMAVGHVAPRNQWAHRLAISSATGIG
jgi:uncharacterized protein (DUF2062 family)